MIPKLIAVLVIAALVWLCVRSWYPIRVTIDSQGIKSGTKLPPQIHKRLAEFAQDNLLSEEQIELRGKVVAGHMPSACPAAQELHACRMTMAKVRCQQNGTLFVS